jgi:glucuronate isomerase
MDAEFHGIRKILEIYLGRSESALAALAAEEWERFDDLMRWRNAAFHNFRAADHLASLKRADYLSDPELQSLGQSVQAIDSRLMQEVEKQRERLNQKLMKINRHRTRIGKFHSGVHEQAGFQKSV